ncbi:hypothetical protein [Croceicoccus sp. YJ47]|uniref:hypothetical protein n=1 Tax=Croceicoccus sp. YJ47 TaxID=2798724 RepID=UPI0019204412|nr:hypothetical protein [Croceicoccus sp. YJ47]QQN75214.1 hypothetical protein JD971_05980 [Croceicoccus sp. YJ47]
MNYTAEEIERAKVIFARAKREGATRHMPVAALVGLSRSGKVFRVSHERTWRDRLPQARRELRGEQTK